MQEGIDGDCHETENDHEGDDHANHFQSLHPDLVVPADGLEHAPETV